MTSVYTRQTTAEGALNQNAPLTNEQLDANFINLNNDKEPAIAPGTIAQYLRGDKTWQPLSKSSVGLDNVDNTSDANKPVSTAQQTALDAKQAALVSGTNIKTVNGNSLLGSGDLEVGYKNIPQNSKSADYTLVLEDSGKHIFHPAADTTARTFTIPANSSVAYPIGTAITFINQAGTSGVVSIAITTDTMRLAGAGTTGTRTLARNGVATAVKITATEWIISGTGLT